MTSNRYMSAEEALATEEMQKFLRKLILTDGKAFSSRISRATSWQLMRLTARNADYIKTLSEPDMKDLLQRLAWNISDGDSVAWDVRCVFFKLTDREFLQSTANNRELPRNLRNAALGVLGSAHKDAKKTAQEEEDLWISGRNSKEQIINAILDQSKNDAYRASAARELGSLEEEWEDEIRDYCIRVSHRSEFPNAVRFAMAEASGDAHAALDLAEDETVEKGYRTQAISLCDKAVEKMESTTQKVRLLKRRNVIALKLGVKPNTSVPEMYSRKYIEVKPFSSL